MAEEIKVDVHDAFFVKDGKFFVQKNLGNKDGVAFVQVDKKEYDERVNALANKLVEESGVSAVQIVAQALRYMDLNSLKKIEKNLIKKRKVRIKKGCVELECGNTIIPIC